MSLAFTAGPRIAPTQRPPEPLLYAASAEGATPGGEARMTNAERWIERLRLVPHPEGGHYREVYRSAEVLPGAALPPRFGGDRAFGTAIYFLLRGQDFSALHRIGC